MRPSASAAGESASRSEVAAPHRAHAAAMLASGERRSPLSGLPIVSTEPLTAAERAALRDLVRAMRATADRVEEALDKNRVAYAIDACAVAGELGTAAQRAAAVIGGSR